jgi:YD repeat-containing protein
MPPAVHQTVDENGVDLFAGTIRASTPDVSIGVPGQTALSFRRDYDAGYFRDSTTGFVQISGNVISVVLGSTTEKFMLSGYSYIPQEARGSTLAMTNGTYTYITSDGTTYQFRQAPAQYYLYTGTASGIALQSIKRQNGEVITYYYRDQVAGAPIVARRLQSIWSSKGYHLKLTYQADTITAQYQIPSYLNLVGVTGFNLLLDGCSFSANSCTASGARPTASLTPTQFVDGLGRTTTYSYGVSGITAIQLPGSTSADMTVSYSNGRVGSVTTGGVTTSYSHVDNGNERTVSVSQPGKSQTFQFDISSGVLTRFIEAGGTTQYDYSAGVLVKVTYPEGNAVIYARDARGNVTSTTYKAKPGSALADVVTSGSYPCSVAAACNRPETTTDALGAVTNYSYDAAGNLVSVKGPAPVAGGDRAEKRYSYTLTNGAQLLTSMSSCRSGVAPACVGTAAETRVTYGYDAHQQQTTLTRASGDGALAATSTFGYDPVGNLASVDGPLAGGDDTP